MLSLCGARLAILSPLLRFAVETDSHGLGEQLIPVLWGSSSQQNPKSRLQSLHPFNSLTVHCDMGPPKLQRILLAPCLSRLQHMTLPEILEDRLWIPKNTNEKTLSVLERHENTRKQSDDYYDGPGIQLLCSISSVRR